MNVTVGKATGSTCWTNPERMLRVLLEPAEKEDG